MCAAVFNTAIIVLASINRWLNDPWCRLNIFSLHRLFYPHSVSRVVVVVTSVSPALKSYFAGHQVRLAGALLGH